MPVCISQLITVLVPVVGQLDRRVGSLGPIADEGVGKAVDFLSKEDGYLKSVYKIPIPAEAQKVFDKVKKVPGFEDAET